MLRLEMALLTALALCAGHVDAQQDRSSPQFELVDRNNDGFVDREEYDRAKSSYAIRSTFEQLDFDKDGKVSRQEALRAYELREIDRTVQALFKSVDTDGNGTINRSEFRQSDISKRYPGSFQVIDADQDGALSEEEIRRAIIKRRGLSSMSEPPRPGINDEPDLVAPKATPLPRGMPAILFRDQPYDALPGVDPRLLSLDIYEAKGEGPHPILVMVHGGGWMAGDKTGRGVIAPKASWFAEKGFIFASVNYRLSPAVSHPEHANDVAQAIGWLAEHAEEFGGDPQRIFLMGHSAGAHIVAAVGTDPRHLERAGCPPTLVKGTIPLDVGAYDMSLRTNLPPDGRRIYEAAFGTPGSGQTDPWAEASPITHVKGPDAAERIAPFLLVSSSQPQRRVARTNTRAFAKALREHEIMVEVVEVDKTHGECSSHVGVPGDPLTLAVDAFLKRRLQELSTAASTDEE